jgi:hemerythrin-like domain-containing protein
MSRTSRNLPFAAGAGFDDPLDMLLGCHRRIQKQLGVLKALPAQLAEHGPSAEASAAALALLDYFGRAAVHHHMDEERDLFPLLEARITDSGEQARFRAFRETLHEDHHRLNEAWSRLQRPLQLIADGHRGKLAPADVESFVGAYAQHIVIEEQSLADFFNRWLTEADRDALGRAMEARRNGTRH